MSAMTRDETSVFRHWAPGCVLCGRELHPSGTGRRLRYCGEACRQRAYRLRDEARRPRDAEGRQADPAEVASLLAAVLGLARTR